MTTRNGKMFSIIITVIYFRCILCETTESTGQTEILSTGTINTTLVSTTYSTLETTNSSQRETSNIEITEYPTNTTATETSTQTNTSSTISNFSSMNLSILSTEPSQDTNATSFVNTTPHSTITVQSRTTQTDKLQGMTLEEKQTRNGLASAVICIGSLILIVIAYLSSFIDKPSEKVPKIDRKELQNSKYTFDNEGQIPNVKEETGRKISFGEVSQFSKKQTPDTTNDIQMTNVKETVTDDHSGNIKGIKTEGQPDLGVFAQNRKFFENYQPKRTVTN